jgi:hypothetical protein
MASFEAWQLLLWDQGLTPDRAKEAMTAALMSLLGLSR